MKKLAIAVLIGTFLSAIPFVAIAQEAPSDEAATKWTAKSLPSLMTFGFNDYRRRLQESSHSFTRHGWESFTDALQRSRIIEMVNQYEQDAEMKLICPPTLVSSHVDGGIKTWQFKALVTITYKGRGESRSDNQSITVAVKQSSDAENTEGLGIDQYISVPLESRDMPSSCDGKTENHASP